MDAMARPGSVQRRDVRVDPESHSNSLREWLAVRILAHVFPCLPGPASLPPSPFAPSLLGQRVVIYMPLPQTEPSLTQKSRRGTFSNLSGSLKPGWPWDSL